MKIGDLQRTPLVEAFLEAGTELGHEIVDINGANQLGAIRQIYSTVLFSATLPWFLKVTIHS